MAWVIATVGLIIFVDRAFVEKTSGIIYSDMVRISWVAYSYFERLVFLFFSVPTLLVIVLNMVGVFLTIFFMYAISGSILRRVVPFFRSYIDDRYIGRNVMDVYYLNFLIGVFLNKMALLSVF